MAKITFNDSPIPYTDDDSGIGIDVDNASSNGFNSSSSTLIESSPSFVSQSDMSSAFPTVHKKQFDSTQLIKFTSDGVVERVRPMTMKNSENGDYVICHTNRGNYIAYRTPIVPEWITRLVEEVESREQ
ncbi:hypothetical protein I4U23_002836 [Adineta vaga]|nr:hypothetical protein I4U23_002836 [Adineta vaga]